MLEIEIKAKCDSHENFEKRIRGLGAVETGELHEVDYYFNHPSRDFKETGEAFRIRIQNGNPYITYKGAKLDDIVKTRFEAETSIGNYDLFKAIIVNLGFREVAAVEKRRVQFEYEDITICLDSVKNAGNFVELEMIGDDRTMMRAKLVAFAQQLGIHEFESRSYLAMILNEDGE
jgi:adenylate cyclase, class 2